VKLLDASRKLTQVLLSWSAFETDWFTSNVGIEALWMPVKLEFNKCTFGSMRKNQIDPIAFDQQLDFR
jgi:hypothetical protein